MRRRELEFYLATQMTSEPPELFGFKLEIDRQAIHFDLLQAIGISCA